MGAAQIREELHQFINHADERILNLMYGMMKADIRKDEALEASIDKALEQSKKGEVRPHEQVMSEIRDRYKE
jgi:predicted transcriptional regulator